MWQLVCNWIVLNDSTVRVTPARCDTYTLKFCAYELREKVDIISKISFWSLKLVFCQWLDEAVRRYFFYTLAAYRKDVFGIRRDITEL